MHSMLLQMYKVYWQFNVPQKCTFLQHCVHCVFFVKLKNYICHCYSFQL